jgi:hypothetical protein
MGRKECDVGEREVKRAPKFLVFFLSPLPMKVIEEVERKGST